MICRFSDSPCGSILARTRASNVAAPRRPLTRFEVEWRRFSVRRTPADYQAWRDHRDWTAQKYAMWERCEKQPSQKPSSMMLCPCGVMFDSHRPEESLPRRRHIYTEHQALETH